MVVCSMRKSFKDSLKVLEADIQHANTLAADFSRDYDGACLQMRMSYSPAAHFFLFLVQWIDCSLAGALGLLRILIYKVYVDGSTTMSTHERKASIREFYAVIFPSLMQLPKGISDVDDWRQKAVCTEKYRRRDEDEGKRPVSEIDIEREEECGICMEMNSKVVLPSCSHAMCMKCYRQWRSRSQSCPFCRDSLKRVNSGDLWMFTDCRDVVDMATVTRENIRRLFMYIEKLPLVTPDNIFYAYDSHECCMEHLLEVIRGTVQKHNTREQLIIDTLTVLPDIYGASIAAVATPSQGRDPWHRVTYGAHGWHLLPSLLNSSDFFLCPKHGSDPRAHVLHIVGGRLHDERAIRDRELRCPIANRFHAAFKIDGAPLPLICLRCFAFCLCLAPLLADLRICICPLQDALKLAGSPSCAEARRGGVGGKTTTTMTY
ncbi:unnamed protein product [Miscanthus lutarioriparius]|uniref:RING-type domain-containing protein n=1 Tax=Miscanthus lutarioriparius TaxID=422564 RepID=A0A811QE43_9POAL|nr:unnamed protein product [Miscanthus lutarioriparius]